MRPQKFSAWRWYPVGTDLITTTPDPSGHSSVVIQRKRGCCFIPCFSAQSFTFKSSDIESVWVGKRPVACLSVLWYIILAFWFGFLLHLIPAEFITVAESLGSSSTHSKLGIVWGFLWLAAFIGLVVVRSPVVHVKVVGLNAPIMIAASATKNAEETRDAFKQLSESGEWPIVDSDSVSTVKYYLPEILGVSIYLALIINALVVGSFIVKCNDCGGCRDDGPPRPGCFTDINGQVVG